MLKLITRISKFFATLHIIFKIPAKLFCWSNQIIFRFVSSKILDLSAKLFFPCISFQYIITLLIWEKEISWSINTLSNEKNLTRK